MPEMKTLNSEARLKENPLKTFLQHSAAVLALATALLYLLGWVYGNSYLAAWGLPERLFPLTREGTIITGFFHILIVFAKNISVVAYWLIVLSAVMIATMITCYNPIKEWLIDRLAYLIRPMKGRVDISETHDKIMDSIVQLAVGSILILVCMVGICLLWSWTSKQATERATKELTAIKVGKVHNIAGMQHRARLYVRNDSKIFEIYSGHMIETSSTHAALYTGNLGMVVLPISLITKIEIADRP